MTNDALSQGVAHALATRFEGKSIVTETAGGSLRVGSHALTIRAAVDYVRKANDKVAVGLDVVCATDAVSGDELHAGSIGLDITPDEALRTAVAEWVLQYGIAIVAALHGRPEDGLLFPAFRTGRFVVYPGPAGYRGQAPTGSKTWFHEELFRRLQPVLSLGPDAVVSETSLHAITLTLMVRGDAVESGECRLDGKVSAPVCEVARLLPWPASAEGYMLKQFFVFKGASEGT